MNGQLTLAWQRFATSFVHLRLLGRPSALPTSASVAVRRLLHLTSGASHFTGCSCQLDAIRVLAALLRDRRCQRLPASRDFTTSSRSHATCRLPAFRAPSCTACNQRTPISAAQRPEIHITATACQRFRLHDAPTFSCGRLPHSLIRLRSHLPPVLRGGALAQLSVGQAAPATSKTFTPALTETTGTYLHRQAHAIAHSYAYTSSAAWGSPVLTALRFASLPICQKFLLAAPGISGSPQHHAACALPDWVELATGGLRLSDLTERMARRPLSSRRAAGAPSRLPVWRNPPAARSAVRKLRCSGSCPCRSAAQDFVIGARPAAPISCWSGHGGNSLPMQSRLAEVSRLACDSGMSGESWHSPFKTAPDDQPAILRRLSERSTRMIYRERRSQLSRTSPPSAGAAHQPDRRDFRPLRKKRTQRDSSLMVVRFISGGGAQPLAAW